MRLDFLKVGKGRIANQEDVVLNEAFSWVLEPYVIIKQVVVWLSSQLGQLQA
jgi:hypothetical protein